jgi:hypothetical protein
MSGPFHITAGAHGPIAGPQSAVSNLQPLCLSASVVQNQP